MAFSKVLVTGGAGFIGSNLVEALLRQGVKVVVLDNFLTGKRENLTSFRNDPGFELIEGDIRDFACCRKAVSGCDAVFHEAALGSVPRSMKNPQLSLEINMQGFVNVIEAARLEEVKKFVYASSSSIYGDDSRLPKTEERHGRALSPYALSKQIDETVAEHYSRIFGLPTVGLRYFNVFGRRQDPESAYAAVIPKFIKALLEHRAPVINGDGNFSRDFTYIDNVVQANILALHASSRCVVCNIACGEKTTLSELFCFLRETLQQTDPEIGVIEAQHAPVRAGDIPHSLAEIERARQELGYHPEISVREGLKRTVVWYRDHLR